MWGYRVDCRCLICNTLPRIFALVVSEIGRPAYTSFVDFVDNNLRRLEGELRDEVARRTLLTVPPAPKAEASAVPPAPAATREEEKPSQAGTTESVTLTEQNMAVSFFNACSF